MKFLYFFFIIISEIIDIHPSFKLKLQLALPIDKEEFIHFEVMIGI